VSRRAGFWRGEIEVFLTCAAPVWDGGVLLDADDCRLLGFEGGQGLCLCQFINTHMSMTLLNQRMRVNELFPLCATRHGCNEAAIQSMQIFSRCVG